ncbi:MAG: hypothetical protein ACXVAM_01810 [Vulcanimicrobiaceae bacterium]
MLLSLLFTLAQATATPSPALVTPAPLPTASPSASATPSAPPGQLLAQPLQANVHPVGLQQPPAVIAIAASNGALAATLDQPVATVQIDQLAHTISLQGTLQTGRSTLHVTDASGASVDIPVRNAYDAGTIAPAATLKVTGNALDPLWLQAQIGSLLSRITLAQPGVKMQLGGYTLPPELPPGATAALAVPVQIPGGDQYYDVSGTSSVTIANVAAAPFAPPTLFYDDDPEKVNGVGVLYRGTVSATMPARLYYYHENGQDPHDLLLVLSTAAQDPASLQLIDSTAGPNIDVLSVGHNVTKNFLLMKPRNQGIVVDLPSGQPYVVHDLEMQRLDGVAGNVDVRVMTGGPVTVTVLALPPSSTGTLPAPDQIATYLAQPQLPGDGHHRTGVFSLSKYGDDALQYTVGGQDVSTRYGATTPPTAGSAEAGHDYGDYGVMHTIVFALSNSTNQPATLYLYQTPLGGVLRSSYLVDGQLHEVGCTRVPNRYLIAQLPVLNPGERRTTTVLTMTDGGSSYPVEVGVTATPPQPVVPPISAPDGCFPKGPSAPVSPPLASPSPTVSPESEPTSSPVTNGSLSM